MLPMEIAHAILTAKIVKKSWKKESLRKYTLASFIIFLLVAGGNTVLLNLLTFRNFSKKIIIYLSKFIMKMFKEIQFFLDFRQAEHYLSIAFPGG